MSILEKYLSTKIRHDSHFLKKLVPPEYLYPKESWRTIVKEGVKLKLDISNVVDHEIYFNLNERTFSRFINSLKDVKLFWDIGANIGWTVLQVSQQFPNAKIYAFEPSSKNRKRLQEHISLNDVNAEIVPFGLGDKPNTFRLYSVLESNPGMNRILNEQLDLPFENIEVITGASFWEKIETPKVDALKIDVEGFEMHVLLGIEAIIDIHQPSMFIEVDEKNLGVNGYSAKGLLNWLFEKEYKLFNAQSSTRLIPPFDNLPNHFDVLANKKLAN